MRTLAIILIFAVTCPGCGGGGPAKAKLYPVSGKVTVGGKPLAKCGIAFAAVSAAPDAPAGYQGKLSDSGDYTLMDADGRSGAAPGKYKVVLSIGAEAAKEAMMKGGAAPGYAANAAPFPKEYMEATTSPKEVEVKAESNTINIDI